MAWSPQAREGRWFPLDASRDEDGDPQARVQMTPWTARERLAYMDATAAHVRTEHGQRVVEVGGIALDHLARTLTDAEGFGVITLDDGSRATFDPRNRDHLLALSGPVLDELMDLAEQVQPQQRKRAEPAKVGVQPAGADADLGDDDEDPSLGQ